MTCGFCFNLGLSTYTTHSVKHCQQLSNTRCNYCKCLGHTPKFCPKLAKKKEELNMIKQYFKMLVVNQPVRLRILVDSPPAEHKPLGPRQTVPTHKQHEEIKTDLMIKNPLCV